MKSAKAGDIIVVPKLTETQDRRHAVADRATVAIDPLAAARAPVPRGHRGGQQEGRGQAGDVPGPRRRDRPHHPRLPQRGNPPDRAHRHGRDPGGDAHLPPARSRPVCRRCWYPCASPTARPSARLPRPRGGTRSRPAARASSATAGCASPRTPASGYEFIDEIVGGKIPRGFIPAIDKGVQDAMLEGYLAGYPMVDHQVRRVRRLLPLRWTPTRWPSRRQPASASAPHARRPTRWCSSLWPTWT